MLASDGSTTKATLGRVPKREADFPHGLFVYRFLLEFDVVFARETQVVGFEFAPLQQCKERGSKKEAKLE